MKKYPYTDSTDLVIYDKQEKKNKGSKKPKTWLVAMSSAVAASVLTAAVFGTGMFYIEKNKKPTVTQQASTASVVQSASGDSTQVSQLSGTANGGICYEKIYFGGAQYRSCFELFIHRCIC